MTDTQLSFYYMVDFMTYGEFKQTDMNKLESTTEISKIIFDLGLRTPWSF